MEYILAIQIITRVKWRINMELKCKMCGKRYRQTKNIKNIENLGFLYETGLCKECFFIVEKETEMKLLLGEL